MTQSLLSSTRDRVGQRLGAAWRELVVKLAADLQSRGDLTDERELRNFLYDLRETLLARAARLEDLLAETWRQEFDGALAERAMAGVAALKPAQLELVDLGAFDEDLVLRAFSNKLQEICGEAVYAVGRRIAALSGGRRASDIAGAAAPDILASTLRRSLIAADFGLSERTELLRCLINLGGPEFAALYEEWNEQLIAFNVLPDLRHSYTRASAQGSAAGASGLRVADPQLFALLQRVVAASAAPSLPDPGGAGQVDTAAALAALDTLQRGLPEAAGERATSSDTLRQFRASDVGQGLGQLDAITVDIVAMLFDLIYQDEAIADPIKVLIGRLQIPVLKVALADRRFFSSRAHPARRLLEQVSHAAVQLGRAAGQGDALYGKLAAIIARLQKEFSYDAALLDELCLELEGFLVQQDRVADAQAVAAVPLAEAHESRQTALALAEQALAPCLAAAPPAIAEMLSKEWRQLLARAHSEGDRPGWEAALATAEELLASIKLVPGGEGKKALVDRLPGLIRRIQEGLDRIAVEPERRLQLIDALFGVHAALLRGDPTASVPRSPVPVAAASEASLAQVAQLQRGSWVELASGKGEAQRYRVSWISPARGILLLTNPSLPKGIALTPQALALRLERGRASIVPTEPIFERAVVRALSTLSEEEAAKISLDFT